MAFDELRGQFEARREKALAMGGEAKIKRRRNAGVLNARERIDYLLDRALVITASLIVRFWQAEGARSTDWSFPTRGSAEDLSALRFIQSG